MTFFEIVFGIAIVLNRNVYTNENKVNGREKTIGLCDEIQCSKTLLQKKNEKKCLVFFECRVKMKSGVFCEMNNTGLSTKEKILVERRTQETEGNCWEMKNMFYFV